MTENRTGGNRTSRPRLLIVDDIPANIRSLHAILAEEYDILFATEWRKGLDLAQRLQPDMVLLDVMMPELDGYEICRRLKSDQSTHDIPVVFITALGNQEDEERGLAVGGADYIAKPFRPAIVRLRVRNLLELKLQRDRLEALTMTDGLTGIANRRRFDQHLEEEWRRCARAATPLSAIMLDIDHFKAFNDNYGHAAGDECLRRVARALEAVPNRAGDLVARFGGEEFCCVLPGTDEEGARVVAERMLEVVGEMAIPHAFSSAGKTVSISAGVATIVPSRSAEAGSLIGKADEMLYRAKNAGRSRVAGPEEEAA